SFTTQPAPPHTTLFPYTTLFRSVAKNIDKLKYDPAIGSFKGWLLQITRWRIADQFRKREPGNAKRPRPSDDRATATIERVPDSRDRKSTRLNSSHDQISYAVFCL